MILNYSQTEVITKKYPKKTQKQTNKKYPKETLSNVRKDGSFSNFRENISRMNVKL